MRDLAGERKRAMRKFEQAQDNATRTPRGRHRHFVKPQDVRKMTRRWCHSARHRTGRWWRLACYWSDVARQLGCDVPVCFEVKNDD